VDFLRCTAVLHYIDGLVAHDGSGTPVGRLVETGDIGWDS
jgi:hypothetical protein